MSIVHSGQPNYDTLRRPSYWQPTVAISCSPLDAGQTDVIIERHDRYQILGTQNAHP